ncbi:MAG: hypothetical protein MPK62_07210 [Alphaproteobacteria bacterium]|nr:hypothetical protein [Alphaproteobacteria bacterium]MDA8030901.1 hypothetical protein [Alphaproteobacteria bacterium]
MVDGDDEAARFFAGAFFVARFADTFLVVFFVTGDDETDRLPVRFFGAVFVARFADAFFVTFLVDGDDEDARPLACFFVVRVVRVFRAI